MFTAASPLMSPYIRWNAVTLSPPGVPLLSPSSAWPPMVIWFDSTVSVYRPSASDPLISVPPKVMLATVAPLALLTVTTIGTAVFVESVNWNANGGEPVNVAMPLNATVRLRTIDRCAVPSSTCTFTCRPTRIVTAAGELLLTPSLTR